MKIDDRISNYMSLLFADSVKASSKTQGVAGQSATAKSSKDNVSISPVAAQLSDDEAQHHERLLSIKRQLSEGTYNISGKDVANKILKVLKG